MRILLSSDLSCKLSRCESSESFIPSIRTYLALIPSFAANFGLACAGGLIMLDYVI